MQHIRTMQLIDASRLVASQSTINLFNRCNFLFLTKELRGILPRFTPAPMRRGTLIHAGMEAGLHSWHAGNRDEHTILQAGEDALRNTHAEWMDKDHIKPHLTEELRADFDAQTDNAALIFRRSFKATQVLDGRWETLCLPDGTPLIEHKMPIPLTGFAFFGGALDWAMREVETGHKWLADFKSRKQCQGEEYDEPQLQAPSYQHLLRERHGIHLSGTATFQIRAAVPVAPEFNKTKKKGEDFYRLSRGNIVTDKATYTKAVLDAGQDLALYADHIAGLKDFDEWRFYYRSDEEVAAVWRTVQASAHRMSESIRHYNQLTVAGQDGELAFPRVLNPFGCNGCNHREYCLAGIRGHDTEFLRRTAYMVDGEAPFYPMDFLSEED